MKVIQFSRGKLYIYVQTQNKAFEPLHGKERHCLLTFYLHHGKKKITSTTRTYMVSISSSRYQLLMSTSYPPGTSGSQCSKTSWTTFCVASLLMLRLVSIWSLRSLQIKKKQKKSPTERRFNSDALLSGAYFIATICYNLWWVISIWSLRSLRQLWSISEIVVATIAVVSI